MNDRTRLSKKRDNMIEALRPLNIVDPLIEETERSLQNELNAFGE